MLFIFAGLMAVLSFLNPVWAEAEFPETRMYASPDAELDQLVATCLRTEGVNMLPKEDIICYNSAIFPEQFLKLNTLPPASRIILTSPGGNVATARGMSTILDRRAEPVIIAGPCMSACAMVILPGLNQVYIHRTAHIAVHGITFMDYKSWFGWLRQDVLPSRLDLLRAQMGLDFDFLLHDSGRTHLEDHFAGQQSDLSYITSIDDIMLSDARNHDCRVPPKDYWGMLTPEHLSHYLGARLTGMEAFAASWDDPLNQFYKKDIKPIGPRTYIFRKAYREAGCPTDT